METKPTVLILSLNTGVRLALAQILKEEGFSCLDQPKLTKPEEVQDALRDQFKKNFNKKTPEVKCDLIILNCRKNAEYRRALEMLSKEIMKNRFSWNKEGIDFNYDNVTAYLDSCIICHFVKGADFVYQIENNEKVRVSFGDINTDEFLSCTNLFGELGISFSTYFEKDSEPTQRDVQQYNDALKRGKEIIVKKMAVEKLSEVDINKILAEQVRASSFGKKTEWMKKRLLKDINTFLADKAKRKEISQKRVDIMESADTFKQYLAMKDEALRLKEGKDWEAMEKTLKKAIELLEGTGDSGKRTLFDTYIDLGKAQLQQKKFVSSQKNAANARKIRKEAPSPQRLMGECQMGQATEALKNGDYEQANKFFEKANEYMTESDRLAQAVENDEKIENEKEIALTISYFKEETQKIFEMDAKAKDALKTNIAFNLLCKAGADLKKKHKIVEDGEISPDISLAEIANKLREANKALKTPADTTACHDLLRKLFDATAERATEQLLALDGLLAKILENTQDERRYERALIFVRFAMGYDVPQKDLLEQKFHELNLYIAEEQLKLGVAQAKGYLADPDNTDNLKNKEKAMIYFQKAFHQSEEIIEDVAEMMAGHIRSVREQIGNREGILLADMSLKIDFSEEERPKLEPIRAARKEIREIMEKAKGVALEAAGLLLEKKLIEARVKYEEAVKIDELSAFRAASDLAKEQKAEGNVRKAYDLYTWLARVDRNETDLQYLNAAWCCLLLGDRERAGKHIEAALVINKNVIEEAKEMDPEFEQSVVMKFFKEEYKDRPLPNAPEPIKLDFSPPEKAAKAPPPPTRPPSAALDPRNLDRIKRAAQALASKDLKGAYHLLREVHQTDPRAFEKLIVQKPAVKGMPVYVFYQKKVQEAVAADPRAAAGKPFSKEDLVFIMEANKLFMEGNKRDAVLKLIQALKKDRLILVKACGASEKFRQSLLMKFYFQNKVKLPKYLGFDPQP